VDRDGVTTYVGLLEREPQAAGESVHPLIQGEMPQQLMADGKGA
jgi:hypothetical protein